MAFKPAFHFEIDVLAAAPFLTSIQHAFSNVEICLSCKGMVDGLYTLVPWSHRPRLELGVVLFVLWEMLYNLETAIRNH